MECAELPPPGVSNAAMSQQEMKSTTFNPPFSQQDPSPPSPEEKKFLVPVLDEAAATGGSADGHSLLSGCALPAWSAVIHRPAEDSEPDELPSTVDMDAIKGSPSTPKVPYSSSEPWGMGGERDGSDSSDDESDDDSSGSGSDNGGESGSEADGSVSSSCSWTDEEEEEGSSGGREDSSDEDGASSCSSSSSSSASSCSSASRASTATPHQTFSIRETNFDQGGLKLKIATMTVRPSEESVLKGPIGNGAAREAVIPAPKVATAVPTAPPTSNPTTPDKRPQLPSPSMSRLRPRRKEETKGVASGSQGQRAGTASKRGQAELLSHASGPSSSASSRADRGSGQPGGEAAISQLAQELSGDALQEINQEDLAAILPDVSTPEGLHEDVAGPPFDGFEDVSSLSGKPDMVAAAAAAQVAASSAVTSQPQPETESSSEDMELLPEQVVSAAIQRIHLDEDTASCTDGAEPGSSGGRDRAESFSSEDGEDEASDVDSKSPRTSTRIYSSRLLQQFEQKTAMLSQGDTKKSAALSTVEIVSSILAVDTLKHETKEVKPSVHTNKHRRPRGRPPKNPVIIEPEEVGGNKNCPLGELDAFMRLDCCNVSNVSPDSGIQSVAGSPVHQSCSPASNPPVHTSPLHSNLPLSTSPAPPQHHSLPSKSSSPPPLHAEPKRRPGRPTKLQQQVKRRPGRPKGSVSKKTLASQGAGTASPPDHRPERGTLETELPGYVPSTSPQLSAAPLNSSLQPIKRGPGRPKKVISALEPNTSVSPQSYSSGKKITNSLRGELSMKSDSKLQLSSEMSSQSSKNMDSFLSRRAKKAHGLKTRSKSSKTKLGKRSKTKFGIDKRKSRKCLSTGKKRWRSNNIKALTVPFQITNDSALTVAVSHINHKYLSKSQPSNNRKHLVHSKSHSVQSYHPSNHKTQLKSRSVHKSFAHHKLREQAAHSIRKSVKLSSSRLLTQSKHKKKKKKSEQSIQSQEEDPAFISLLDDLLGALRKCSISRTLSLPTPGEARLPSIFRVRRLLKRRKGSERSRNSDRESESETFAAVSAAPPKSPHQATKEKSKRKNKKNAVEPPKRAEPNEQRLPLKKRHYHLTSQQQPTAVEPVVTQEQASPPPLAAPVAFVKASPPSTAAAAQVQVPARADKAQTSSRISRNSIDEAIEACISRYSATKLGSTLPENAEEVGKAVTAATPKKRLKAEESKSPMDQEKPLTLILPPNSKASFQALTSPVQQKRTAAVRSCNQISNCAPTTPQTATEKNSEQIAPSVKIEVETEVTQVETPTQENIKKNKKKSIRDIRVHVTKLNDNDLILKKAVAAVVKKVKRRKTINRTGFPIKRKKKPKIQPACPQSTNHTSAPKTSTSDNSITSKQIETPQKDATSESSSKPAKGMSGKRKHEAAATPAVDAVESVTLAQSVSKRLRGGCKDDNAISTVEELPLMPILSESLFCAAEVPSGDESSKCGKKKQPPRWRKKFLVAGLFSDYYKEDDSKKASALGEVSKSRSTVYKPEEHAHGLLPPPYHCGKYLRQRRVDFQLPHDLWWLHTHNQLPGRDAVPSWNYKKIRTNVYYDVKPPYMYEAQACNCPLPQKAETKGCGDDCINRLVYSECSAQFCPCREICSNQKIQKHDWAPGIEKFMTKDKGWGVKTKKGIKSGEFILEYVGEVVSEKEFKNRMASRYSNDTHHYCLNLDGGLVIDGHRMGGDGRFVNHSCEPNCEMQKWSVNGLFRMALFALRDIEPGEELGYDYNFSLFNPAEGQPCKCGSSHCRGVIGGKSQRVTMPFSEDKDGDKKLGGRLNKNSRKSKFKQKKNSKLGDGNSGLRNQIFAPMRPMSHQQRCFAQMHHCFLLRNLEKVKRVRDKLKHHATGQQETLAANSAGYGRPALLITKPSDVFLAQLNALSTPRSMRTRRLAQAEDNPELTRVARLAYVFKDLYQAVCSAKDDKDEMLATPFVTLPAKRKLPLYYERIQDPIDLTMLEKNITSGLYKTVEAFDQDFCRLFNNNVRFFGRTSELGIAAARLRNIYSDAKLSFQIQLEDILGESPPASFLNDKNNSSTAGKLGLTGIVGEMEEDIIRCICGLYMDEGLMIQCESCLVWQHSDCVCADSSVDHYLCEQCVPRNVNRDILMNPQPDYATPGQTYYISLMREDLQLRQGDTVYVLRDIVRDDIKDPSLPPQKHTYKTLRNAKSEDCDIFRIERLSIDEKGDRFAFGHHYLRPHETYHEPTRRFFPNEVMRVPLYEVVPFDLVLGQCWVLDLPTFCKGRPIGAKEEHVYVCEFRVDKTAHLFTRLAPRTAKQSVAQLCTKPYAFEVFHTRLKPQRTYTPHGSSTPRPRSKSRPHGDDDACSSKSDASRTHSQQRHPVKTATPLPQLPPGVKRAKQKNRLNEVLLALLAKQQCKLPLDVSYLLEPNRRQRKKPASLLSS